MIKEFVTGLCQVGAGFEILVFGFVEFGDRGFAVLVFRLGEGEALARGGGGLRAAFKLALRGQGVVPGLLDLL